MKITNILEVIDNENTIVCKFERFESHDHIFWKQHYGSQTMMYNEKIINENNVQLYDGKAIVDLVYDPCTMHMLIDAGKRVKMFPDCTMKLSHVIDQETEDDNEELMNLLWKRLEIGKSRYNHGVRIEDDTRQWGTDQDSWETMMMEEALDGMIYAAAQLIRIKRRRDLTKS